MTSDMRHVVINMTDMQARPGNKKPHNQEGNPHSKQIINTGKDNRCCEETE